MSTEAQPRTALHGGRLVAKRLKANGVTKLFTLSGGHLFSIYDGCREEGIDLVDTRHEQGAAFAAEGWAKATRQPGVAALTAGPGRDQRHERDGLGAAEQLADAGAGRPRARRPLGPGLAAGDRPRALRRAAHQARAHGAVHGRDPRPGGRGAGRRARAAHRAHLPRLPARPGVHGGRGRGRRAGLAARPARRARGRRGGPRRRAAALGRAPGDHGRHRAVLGPRRAGAARAGRGAADPGLPQRPGPGLRAGRPPVLLLRARGAPP